MADPREPLAWNEVAAAVERALGEPVSGGRPLTPGWSSRTTWAAHGGRAGPLVVKARRGERPYEKTQWCADRLPLLGARGYPVPSIISLAYLAVSDFKVTPGYAGINLLRCG